MLQARKINHERHHHYQASSESEEQEGDEVEARFIKKRKADTTRQHLTAFTDCEANAAKVLGETSQTSSTWSKVSSLSRWLGKLSIKAIPRSRAVVPQSLKFPRLPASSVFLFPNWFHFSQRIFFCVSRLIYFWCKNFLGLLFLNCHLFFGFSARSASEWENICVEACRHGSGGGGERAVIS